MKEQSIIITAGGVGKRMAAHVPKQFLALNGKPILMHTIELFYTYNSQIEIILVLPNEEVKYWEDLCKKHHFTIAHKIVEGGKERFYSVKNGLAACNGDIIGVHDAVRPLVSLAVIERCFEAAEKYETAIPVIDITESVRIVDGESSEAIERALFKIVQTPQCFNFRILTQAYNQPYEDCFTDDASVVEKWGVNVHLVKGNSENIKITRPIDLVVAESLLNR
jgi:2-C-methyl-D-erythritol 4-phosphate cytidylyltransferase